MADLRSLLLFDETELLRRTARNARRLAPCLCNRDPAKGPSCDWYHGFWPYLRLLGVSSSAAHKPLFEAGFRHVQQNGGLHRLLIAGGADNGLLLNFAQACDAIGLQPTFGFVDRCATPVVLNRWTARRLGLRLEATRAHLLGHVAAAPFDVICCHNLLIFMAPEHRAPLLRHWRRQLRPGGRLLLLSSIHLDPDELTEPFIRKRADLLVERVRKTYGNVPVDLPLDELTARAERYGLRMRNRYITSDAEFSALIDAEDWEIVDLRFGPIGVSKGTLSSSGQSAQQRRYAWLEAVRR